MNIKNAFEHEKLHALLTLMARVQKSTHVDKYRRSTPDTKFQNNWSTKGNQNLVTGKNATKVTPLQSPGSCFEATPRFDISRWLHGYTNYLYICAVQNQVKTVTDVLFEIVEGQQGYFTAKQAGDAGYKPGSQAHHVKSGNWVRVERGIYRLARFPQSPEEQLVIYALWSRNREGEPEGVYSHQTAMGIHELSDVNPAKLHMTVPVAFRRRAKTPKSLLLHRANLATSDVQQRQGFAVTCPLRAVADLATTASVSRDMIDQALREGRRRGLITSREVTELRRGNIPKWFDDLLAANKK
jgi:hypothetical protein